MKLGELSLAEVWGKLRRGGIALHTGPFIARLRSPFRDVAEAVYADYAPCSLSEEGFADFHLELRPVRGIRRWVRPQIGVFVDGVLAFKPAPRRLAAAFVEWGLNWCVATFAHQYLMIHAAALERDGHAVILCGKAGAGKSTLCAALALRGWRLFSDELTLVRPEDGHLVPLGRPVCLKNQSISILRNFSPAAQIGRVWHDTAKGSVAHMQAPGDSLRRAAQTAPPAWVVFVQYEAGAPAESVREPRGVAFLRLANNAFNYSLLGQRGFETMARLVEQCHCYRFRYGSLDEAIARFDQLPSPRMRSAR